MICTDDSIRSLSADQKMAYIKPSLLAGLLRDPAAVLDQMMQLKRLLPGADVSRVAVGEPQLLLQVCAAPSRLLD